MRCTCVALTLDVLKCLRWGRSGRAERRTSEARGGLCQVKGRSAGPVPNPEQARYSTNRCCLADGEAPPAPWVGFSLPSGLRVVRDGDTVCQGRAGENGPADLLCLTVGGRMYQFAPEA